MGPPNPAMNPAAHGTKHCQRYSPLPGVRNVNVVVVWSYDRLQGALPHGFFAEATYVGNQGTDVKTPRNFGIDPSGKFLIVANQDSDSLVVVSVSLNRCAAID